MKQILFSFGTRPEAIKICPVINELRQRNKAIVKVCITGQHKEMLEQVLDVFDVIPDYNLSIMKHGQTLDDITCIILEKFPAILEETKPDIVVVHGDTTSAFAVSLSCFYRKIPVAHVEAGLRTYDIYSPYPEEFNRRMIDIIAMWQFAPTEDAKRNLTAEGISNKNVYVTGNTVVDALKTTVQTTYENALLNWVGDKKLIILTAHRRENWGKPMQEMFAAIKRIAMDFSNVKIVYPVHMNPKVKELADEMFLGLENIKLVSPLDVVEFHNILARCFFVLTDSGGIQEEASALGKPVLVMRDTTERPEGIRAGTLKLVGTKEETIYSESVKLLNDHLEYNKMCNADNPYGDGNASKRIVDILLDD